MTTTKTGKLFIISGPSQVGKDTIVKILQRDRRLNLAHIITNTTRPKRAGERNHVYINFLSEIAFNNLIKTNQLLEWANVNGYHYGTPKQPVLKELTKGRSVILNIEVRGAAQIKAKLPRTILIFIKAESSAEIKRRIFASPKMTTAIKQKRWRTAQAELKASKNYDYIVVNRWGQLKATVTEVKKIIKRHLNK
jgi:guanylate kinase